MAAERWVFGPDGLHQPGVTFAETDNPRPDQRGPWWFLAGFATGLVVLGLSLVVG